jgi:hypothetical protein
VGGGALVSQPPQKTICRQKRLGFDQRGLRSSGLDFVDLNRDGKPDLIYTNGDGSDYASQGFRPWHGIQWLENRDGRFVYHRVGDLPGAYAPCAADLNGDGFLDLVAVSGFADWSHPKAVSMMAWLNDGRQNFTPVVLAHQPIQLVTAAVGDLDGNGVPVIVTGGCFALPPFERMSSVTLWRKNDASENHRPSPRVRRARPGGVLRLAGVSPAGARAGGHSGMAGSGRQARGPVGFAGAGDRVDPLALHRARRGR